MPVDLRPSQALKLWHDVTLDLVRDADADMTARQTAILLTVYLEPPPHTVRGLAAKLNVTKPVITRALDTMGRMELLQRRRDPIHLGVELGIAQRSLTFDQREIFGPNARVLGDHIGERDEAFGHGL